jgi:drug/metabolite transporter (DMT)-like permease
VRVSLPLAPTLSRPRLVPQLRRDDIRLGILYMLASVFLFSLQNVTVKWLAARYPTAEMVFFRSAFSLLPAAILVWRAGGPGILHTRRLPQHLLRAGFWGGSLGAAFVSYHLLPLADAISLSFAAPLFLTALSWPLLKEPVGRYRWSAVVVGFVGVLVMSHPSGGGNTLGLACGVMNALFGALGSISVRGLSRTEPSASVVFYMGLFIALFSVPLLPFVWVRPDWFDLVALCSLGLVGGVGQYWTTQALYYAPAATVAPFNYTAIIWGLILGFLIWHEVPDGMMVLGALIVTASGLFILRREAFLRARRQASLGPAADPPAGTEPAE